MAGALIATLDEMEISTPDYVERDPALDFAEVPLTPMQPTTNDCANDRLLIGRRLDVRETIARCRAPSPSSGQSRASTAARGARGFSGEGSDNAASRTNSVPCRRPRCVRQQDRRRHSGDVLAVLEDFIDSVEAESGLPATVPWPSLKTRR